MAEDDDLYDPVGRSVGEEPEETTFLCASNNETFRKSEQRGEIFHKKPQFFTCKGHGPIRGTLGIAPQSQERTSY